MAQYKLSEADDGFLAAPQGAAMISSGTSGTESWIARDKDVTVRLVIAAVAVATADGATLNAVIEAGGAVAKAEDGPMSADTHLQVMQSVQVALKPGEPLTFKAYASPRSARILRSVVYTVDLK